MTIKSLLVKIGADVSEFDTKIGAAEKKFQTMTAGMERIGRGLTAAVTLPLIGIGAASIKMAADAIESDNLFEVAMGDMAGSARTFSEELRSQLGLNEYEVRKNTGTLYQMTTSMGLTKNAAYEVSTGFTKLAYDMGSFFNLSPEEAFQKLRSGIVGEVEPLRRLGITLDENTVKTYAYKNGIAAQGAELTTAQKVMARYGVIMEQTKNAQGDLARTADSPTNKLRIMKEQVKALSIDLGMSLMPAFQTVLGVIKPLINMLQGAVKVFTSLPGPVKSVVIVFGGLAAGAGPTLMILSRMIPVMHSIGGASKILGLGLNALPFAAVAAAAGIYISKLMELKDAEDAAAKASVQCAEVEGKLWDKLSVAAAQAGVTGKAWEDLTNKYHLNAAALAMAIKRGKEGEELQQALAEVGKKHAAVIDAQKKALEAAAQAEQKHAEAQQKAKQVETELINLRKQMTEEIVTASMTEYQKQKWSLDQQYAERVAWINKEVAGVQQRNALLLQADQAYQAQKAVLDSQHNEEQKAKQIEFLNQARTVESEFRAAILTDEQNYAKSKQEVQDGINQITMSGLQYTLWALEQERAAKVAELMADKDMTSKHRDDLLALWNNYYDLKKKAAMADADEMKRIFDDIKVNAVNSFRDWTNKVLDNFVEIGKGTKDFGDLATETIQGLADMAISVIRDTMQAVLVEALKNIIASKASAIASVIASVMKSVPFPLNLALVGGAIAAVTALFSKIKLAEGGVVTRPTTALIGERGPEAVIPLKKFGLVPSLAGGPSVTINAHFYGSIGSQVDVDLIGRTLGEKVSRALQAGRS